MNQRDYDRDPPAFPTHNEQQTGPSTYHMEGMSMRDYFAAAALTGIGTWIPSLRPNGQTVRPIQQGAGLCDKINREARAEWAYAQADAMLSERAKAVPA